MQYIYTMKGLGKVHPPDAVVLKDIWLSFLPGARIATTGPIAPDRPSSNRPIVDASANGRESERDFPACRSRRHGPAGLRP